MADFHQRGPIVTLPRLVSPDKSFACAIAEGCLAFAEDPLGTPPLPNWERIFSAVPQAASRLLQAVEDLPGILLP